MQFRWVQFLSCWAMIVHFPPSQEKRIYCQCRQIWILPDLNLDDVQVPYSEHSGFHELVEFVRWLQPREILPSVGNDGGGPKCAKMLQLLTAPAPPSIKDFMQSAIASTASWHWECDDVSETMNLNTSECINIVTWRYGRALFQRRDFPNINVSFRLLQSNPKHFRSFSGLRSPLTPALAIQLTRSLSLWMVDYILYSTAENFILLLVEVLWAR